MEKFFLCTFLFCDKLDIVDHQQVDFSVFVTEFLHFIVLDGIDQFICECFTCDIQHLCIGVFIHYEMTDGMHQVRFAQTGVTVQIQRVIGMGGFFCNRQRCGMGHSVTAADYEGVENIFRVQITVCHGFFLFRRQVDLLQSTCFLFFRCYQNDVIFCICHQFHRCADQWQVAFFQRIFCQSVFRLQNQTVPVNAAGNDRLDPCDKADRRRCFLLDDLQSIFPDFFQFH